jgi:hypothetical protein
MKSNREYLEGHIDQKVKFTKFLISKISKLIKSNFLEDVSNVQILLKIVDAYCNQDDIIV